MNGSKSRSILTGVLCVVAAGCSDSGVEVIHEAEDFGWDVTELSYSGVSLVIMSAIWGSDAENIYVSGFSSVGASAGAIFHYDGIDWTPVTSMSSDYGDLTCILGFGPNDVWMGGSRLYSMPAGDPDPIRDSAAIFHLGGASWQQILPGHFSSRGVRSMCGSSPANLYFGTYDGKVLHFDGTQWSVDTIYAGMTVYTLGGDDERMFAMGSTAKGNGEDSVMWFTKTTGGWSEAIQVQPLFQYLYNPAFGISDIFSPAPGQYYACGINRLFEYQQGTWMPMLTVDGILNGLGGTSPNDMYVVGGDSTGALILHWNGIAWSRLSLASAGLTERFGLSNVWAIRGQAFAVGGNYSKSYVLRGR